MNFGALHALPAHVCDKLDKINRDFLWGSTSDRKKMHLVGWNKIVKSKEKGGLGIQAARAKNIALLLMLNWRMYHEQDANWAKVILHKYYLGLRARSSNPNKLPSSLNWKAIKMGFPIFLKGVCCGIGDGSRVRVWLDNWIRGESLRDMIEGPLNQGDLNMIVAEFWHDEVWNWEVVSFVLLEAIKDKIRATPIRSSGERRDTIMWKYSKDREFTAKLAYLLAGQEGNSENLFQGTWVWKLDILPKITNFLWLCLHGSVPVRDVFALRGINCDKLCPLCKCRDETITHLLRDYDLARAFWRKLEPPPSLLSSFTGNLETWLKVNCMSIVTHVSSSPQCTLFLFAISGLWKNENKVVFDNTIPNPNLHKVCINQIREYYYYVGKTKQPTPKVAIQDKWTKLAEGWHKLNIDGVSLGNQGKVGGGGIIRDSHGRWVKGFSRSIGFTTSIVAESWALRDGLKLAIQLGCQQLEVELDAKVIVGLINSNNGSNRVYSPLLHDYSTLLTRLLQVRVAHVFREANKCTGLLVKRGFSMQEEFTIFETPPQQILFLCLPRICMVFIFVGWQAQLWSL